MDGGPSILQFLIGYVPDRTGLRKFGGGICRMYHPCFNAMDRYSDVKYALTEVIANVVWGDVQTSLPSDG